MPPKKKKGKGEGGAKKLEDPDLHPIEPISYLTQDFRTSLQLFNSENETIKLRAIGRLHKCILESDKFLDNIVYDMYYPNFINALRTENVYILRFATSILKLITDNCDYLQKFTDKELCLLTESIRSIFMQSVETMLHNLSTEIILSLLKFSQIATKCFYSTEVMAKLFDLIKTAEFIESQEKYLNIIFYLLDAESAESELLSIPNISLQIILCFLKSDDLRSIGLSIVHKLVCWKNSTILRMLCELNVMESVTNILVTQSEQYTKLASDVLYLSLCSEEADVRYSKTVEFLKFLEWTKACPKTSVPFAAQVIALMTKNDGLQQLLCDFGIDDIILSLLKKKQEIALRSIYEAITNLMNHKYMCFKMTNKDMMNSLADIIEDPHIPNNPYGELALSVLVKFFSYNHDTVHVVSNCSALNVVLDKFCTGIESLTPRGIESLLKIMQVVARSKYVEKMFNISFYTTLMNLYCSNTILAQEEVLCIVKDLMVFQEFRQFFVEKGGIDILLGNVRKVTNFEIVYGSLLVVAQLIKFKKPACLLLDKGIVMTLWALNEKYKNRTCLCSDILRTLFDLCLTVKFFYTGVLSSHDRIRHQFYLIPDEMTRPTEGVEAVSTLQSYTPIYVVLYGSLMKLEEYRFAGLQRKAKQQFKKLFPKRKDLGELKNLEAPQESEESKKHSCEPRKRAPKIVMNSKASYVATKFIHGLCKGNHRRKPSCELTVSKPRHVSNCGDLRLARFITEIYQELYLNPKMSYSTPEKLEFIAKFVGNKLSDFEECKSKVDKKHILNLHLMHLKEIVGSNFIPIGYLRKGLTCERALLYKVICDQMHISTSLRQHSNGVYWNGVYFLKRRGTERTEAVTSVEFMVDLMNNIGDLIPVNTASARHYLQQHAKY